MRDSYSPYSLVLLGVFLLKAAYLVILSSGAEEAVCSSAVLPLPPAELTAAIISTAATSTATRPTAIGRAFYPALRSHSFCLFSLLGAEAGVQYRFSARCGGFAHRECFCRNIRPKPRPNGGGGRLCCRHKTLNCLQSSFNK